MNSASQADREPHAAGEASSRRWLGLVWRLAIVAVLFGLVGLSALAKDSVYLPRADAAHYINIANKMNVGHSPAALDHAPLAPVAKVMPPAPADCVSWQQPPEAAPATPLAIVLSRRYRSPPAFSLA